MAVFVTCGEVSSAFVDIRTEKQQANSVQPQCGLALWERLFCKVTTGILGLKIGKSALYVAAADLGSSLRFLSGIYLGMTGPRAGSCQASSLSPSNGMEGQAEKGSRLLPAIPSRGNSPMGETVRERGLAPEQYRGKRGRGLV